MKLLISLYLSFYQLSLWWKEFKRISKRVVFLSLFDLINNSHYIEKVIFKKKERARNFVKSGGKK
jgi:hypothetical protein